MPGNILEIRFIDTLSVVGALYQPAPRSVYTRCITTFFLTIRQKGRKYIKGVKLFEKLNNYWQLLKDLLRFSMFYKTMS